MRPVAREATKRGCHRWAGRFPPEVNGENPVDFSPPIGRSAIRGQATQKNALPILNLPMFSKVQNDPFALPAPIFPTTRKLHSG